MAELSRRQSGPAATDVGPVITAEAQATHRCAYRGDAGARPAGAPGALPAAAAHGTFVPPTVIEIESMADLTGEVFGPVLHVVRYRRDGAGRAGRGDQRHRLRR